MKIHSIWESKKPVIDKYTIVFEPETHRGIKYWPFLGMSEGGRSVSMFGELKQTPNRYLGKKIQFEDLSEETQKHIKWRLDQ